MPSNQVTERIDAARFVGSSIQTHGAEAAAKLRDKFVAADDRAAVPDLGPAFQAAGLRLERRAEALRAADEAHDRELLDDHGPRRARDEAAAAVHEGVSNLRAVVNSVYGAGSDERLLGVGGETSRTPDVLARQAELSVSRLKAGALPAAAGGVAVDTAWWIARIGTPLQVLQASLTQVDAETREAETSLVARDARLAEFDDELSAVAGWFSASLRLAGMTVQAERVRPSTRRRGRLADADDAAQAATDAAAPGIVLPAGGAAAGAAAGA